MGLRLSHFNTLLVVVIIVVNLAIIGLPLWPTIRYQADRQSARAKTITRQMSAPSSPVSADAQQLLVPSMILDAPIHDGQNTKTLRQGLWRLPHSSTPDKGGNTVIVAHRFTYTNPRGTFYHLDKVYAGEKIAVLWHGKKYTYTVAKVDRVAASRLDVESATSAPTLTLYTCTPLWNPKDRLVVTAVLQEKQP